VEEAAGGGGRKSEEWGLNGGRLASLGLSALEGPGVSGQGVGK